MEHGRRREQPLDRDLVLPPLVLVRVQPGGGVEPGRTARHHRLQLVGLERDGLRTGLAVREGDGEGGGEAVAQQVDPVAGDPQRMVDLDLGVFPGVAVDVVADLVPHLRAVVLGLAGGQELGLEGVDLHAELVEVGAVDQVAGPERVVDRRGGVAQAFVAVGHQDAGALVAVQLACRDRDEQRQESEVEDQVSELAQVTLLR